MMGGGMGMMGGGFGWMMLMPILWFTALAILIGGAVRWLSRQGRATSSQKDSPIAVLEKRYAQGDLSEEEFRHRREQLVRDE